MSKVILYTTGCPNCLALEKLMKKNGIIPDSVISDYNIMSEKGILSVPMLEVDGKLLNFYQAVQWIWINLPN